MFALSGCGYFHSSSYKTPPAQNESKLFRGVYHVHSAYSPDSKASLSQILKAGRQAKLDFVIVTDHNNRDAAASYEKIEKNPQDPKLFFGVEIPTREGNLTALGISSVPPRERSAQKTIEWIHEQGGYVFLSQTACAERPWINWKMKNADGIEIYNFGFELEKTTGFSQTVKKIFFSPKAFLKAALKTPYTELTIWDNLLKEKKVLALAATDSHIRKRWLGVTPQNLLMSFQSVTLYVQAESLEAKNLWEAIGRGKAFMAFEVLGSAGNFSFKVRDGENTQGPGSEVSFKEGMDFHVEVPEEAEIRLIRDAQIVERIQSRELAHKTQAKGTYRVEVYRKGKLWIFSNPIWVS